MEDEKKTRRLTMDFPDECYARIKDKAILDLKTFRLLVELLDVPRFLVAFDIIQVGILFDSDPFNLEKVMDVISRVRVTENGHHKDLERANSLLAEACIFVAPKKKATFMELLRDLGMRRMFREEGPKLYKRHILPTLLEMIDLALADGKEEVKQ